jgi:hypothetical protein
MCFLPFYSISDCLFCIAIDLTPALIVLLLGMNNSCVTEVVLWFLRNSTHGASLHDAGTRPGSTKPQKGCESWIGQKPCMHLIATHDRDVFLRTS